MPSFQSFMPKYEGRRSQFFLLIEPKKGKAADSTLESKCLDETWRILLRRPDTSYLTKETDLDEFLAGFYSKQEALDALVRLFRTKVFQCRFEHSSFHLRSGSGFIAWGYQADDMHHAGKIAVDPSSKNLRHPENKRRESSMNARTSDYYKYCKKSNFP